MISRKETLTLFPVKKRYKYFNFASDGPFPTLTVQALLHSARERSDMGYQSVDLQYRLYEDIRDELAELFQSKRDRFAVVPNTSAGILLALLALDIQEEQNYVVCGDGFPATRGIMANHCRGQKRTVTMTADENIYQQITRQIDSGTRLLVLDWVHFYSGLTLDLDQIAEIARKHDLFTIIDGIQGAGSIRVSLDSCGIDFFVAGGQKWLLSPQGSGFIYVADRVWERVEKKSFGWLGYEWFDFSDFTINPELRKGAEVMEFGTRSYTTNIAFLESLKLLNRFGIETIHNHNQRLKDMFIKGIDSKGYLLINRQAEAPIVSFKPPQQSSIELKEKLWTEQFRVALRDDFIRASFHLVNDSEEVQALLDFL